MLEKRLERIKVFIDNGYTADLDTGIVYSPSRSYSSNELKQRGSVDKVNGYVQLVTRVSGKGVFLQAHHLTYYLATGKVVEQLDHINRIRTDNRPLNLREVTHAENQWNQSNVKGYCYRKDSGKYKAYIQVNKKFITIGNYPTEEEARHAHLDAKEKLHTIGDIEQSDQNIKEFLKEPPKYYRWCGTHKKWVTQIPVGGKIISRTYNTEEAAKEAVTKAKEVKNIDELLWEPKHYGWCKTKNRWVTHFAVNGKKVLGRVFRTEEEAKKAVTEAKLKYNKP